jgi:prepilin-type N-terminal cleavage/methylation domain-containing protein
MIPAMNTRRMSERGFTLIETIVALALMGLLLSALASITAQWLPSWNRGLDRIQRSELIGIALERIGADLAAAEFVPANRDSRHPLFDGTELSVMFVRTSVGPNAGRGSTWFASARAGIAASSSRFARRRDSHHLLLERRCRNRCISAAPWCCCARPIACRLPMPVLTGNG